MKNQTCNYLHALLLRGRQLSHWVRHFEGWGQDLYNSMQLLDKPDPFKINIPHLQMWQTITIMRSLNISLLHSMGKWNCLMNKLSKLFILQDWYQIESGLTAQAERIPIILQVLVLFLFSLLFEEMIQMLHFNYLLQTSWKFVWQWQWPPVWKLSMT